MASDCSFPADSAPKLMAPALRRSSIGHPGTPVAQRPQDYFGQTVNIASRVHHLAVSLAILASGTVAADQSRRPAAVAARSEQTSTHGYHGFCKVSSAAALGQQSGAMPLLFWNSPSATRVAMPALPSILSL